MEATIKLLTTWSKRLGYPNDQHLSEVEERKCFYLYLTFKRLWKTVFKRQKIVDGSPYTRHDKESKRSVSIPKQMKWIR